MGPAVAARASAASAGPAALPGRWREVGGLEDLVRLNTPARTAGMVLVASYRGLPARAGTGVRRLA
jgi:hypothetical protein